MSIPIRTFVDVSIAIAPTPAGLAGFGALMMITPAAATGTKPILVAERVRTYNSAADVAKDFPTGEIVACANAYYSQVPKPKVFMVGLVDVSPVAAVLTGAAHSDLTTLQAITAGSFDVSVDGTNRALTAMNFAGQTFVQMAAHITTKLTTHAVCSYDAVKKAFVITSNTTGTSSTISQATGTNAAAFGLAAGVVQNGRAEERPEVALSKCEQKSNKFYGIVADKKYRENNGAEQIAEWVQARAKVFFNTSNDPQCLTTNTNQIIAKLKSRSMGRTLSTYSHVINEYPSASVAGRAFTVNFEGENTTITLHMKKGPSITVADLSPSEYQNLQLHNGNAFVNVEDNNIYSDSQMADGGWFDTVHGTDWMKDHAEKGVFNLIMQSPTKIPYTDAGVGRCEQRLEQTLRQAVRNGLCAPGYDTEGVYHEQGFTIYTIPVGDVSAAVKGTRIYKGMTFKAVGAGALQGAVINGSFSE